MVIHKSTDEIDLNDIRKAKYVQSYIGNAFAKVEMELKLGRMVLFMGTPCQVAGLNSFLNRNYGNLITCDFICHGVPPMKLLLNHYSLLEKRMGSGMIRFDFRPKTNGWSRQMILFEFRNGKTYCRPFYLDPYFNAFYKNISLRSSCYKCKYADKQHAADITLADFWDIKI